MAQNLKMKNKQESTEKPPEANWKFQCTFEGDFVLNEGRRKRNEALII